MKGGYDLMSILHNNYISIGEEWVLDIERGMLTKQDQAVLLSRTQFKILLFLAKNKKNQVSCSEIIEFAWGNRNYATKNTLYVHIYRLRTIIEEDVKRPKFLLTIHNYGYMLYK